MSCPFCLFGICGSKACARGGRSGIVGRLAARLAALGSGDGTVLATREGLSMSTSIIRFMAERLGSGPLTCESNHNLPCFSITILRSDTIEFSLV